MCEPGIGCVYIHADLLESDLLYIREREYRVMHVSIVKIVVSSRKK